MLANGLSGRGHMVVRFTSTLYLCTSNHPIKFNGLHLHGYNSSCQTLSCHIV